MKKILSFFFVLLIAFSCAACGGGGNQPPSKDETVYPDRGYANADSDSWLQIEEGDEDVEINWYINSASSVGGMSETTKVGKYVYEKTGIKINFLSPVLDDGAQLSTMIVGNKLPDVVTVATNTEEQFLLPTEGYVYSLTELAKRYAPSLLNRIEPDLENRFKMADGDLYVLPTHFYTDSDLEAYEQQEGRTIITNGAMVAREDYITEYIEYKQSQNPEWKDIEACTPDGFIEMCHWVRQQHYIGKSDPVVLLSHFTQNGSNGVKWLMQYFCVPEEDENGNLQNGYRTLEYKEALMFLNRLYREGLMTSANFTINAAGCGSYIASGLPFIFIGSPQDFQSQFSAAKIDGYNYVPILMTNANGDVPQLSSLAGKNGWRVHMISKNCKRPDRVIKLFDFLMSEECQSLFYGIEGEDWNYAIEPGGTETKIINGVEKEVTYKYGKIEWTDETWEAVKNNQTASYGFMYFNQFQNPMYPRLTNVNGEVLNQYSDYVVYNLKAALSDYCYIQRGYAYTRNPLDEKYSEMVNIAANINLLINQQLPMIISCQSAKEAENMYNSLLEQASYMGSAELLAYDNAIFKEYKQSIGIQYAFAPNDPASAYHDLTITSIFGNKSYTLEIPKDIRA